MNGLAHDPWLQYRDNSLYAVPSIHHRQVFAQLVFEACFRKRFDVIAIELPHSYQHLGAIDAALKLAPAPTMIIHPTREKVELMEVPISDDPKCKKTELRPVKRGLFYPFTACDSIVMALRCPHLLRNRWPDWKPEVALIDAEYQAGERPHISLPVRDDYEVMVDGLPRFIRRMESQCMAGRCPTVDDHREKVMGSRLRRFLDAGKDVLFVCGAGHWRNICDYLDSGLQETFELVQDQPPPRLILAPIRSEIAWLWGWLEDIPRVLWELELGCQRGMVSDYDKRQSVQTVIRQTIESALGQQSPVSIRRMLTMSRFAETLASTAGRWVPELDDHLVPAAEACVEKPFAEFLKEKALEFPASLPEGCEMARVLPYKDGKWFVVAEGEVFLVEFPKSEGKRSRRIRIPMAPTLTDGEKRQLARESNRPRDWPEEQKLCYIMDIRARELAQSQERETLCRKFSGSMAAGPDWRRTIKARASGEDTLYVRQVRLSRHRSQGTSTLVTPLVWIFDDGCQIIDIHPRGAWKDDGAMAYLGLFYVAETKWLAEGRIRADKLAAIADFGHSRSFCGKKRPSVIDGKKEREADTAYLRSIPTEKQCNRTNWMDDELSNFLGVEHAIATCIKYAADKVILVSRSRAPVSSAVHRYARLKGVKICRVSIDCFARERLERFQWFHWVQCPGQDGYAAPYDWCSRFIPPI